MPIDELMQIGNTTLLIVASLMSVIALVSAPFVFFSVNVGESQIFDEFNIFGDLLDQISISVDHTKFINLGARF